MGHASTEVGCRVHFEGEYGTVLYIGSIKGVDGTWLGVEWDNVSRGKHSGCYNNVTYFVTKVPNAGSFVKISKADLGISCPKAVKMKYGQENISPTPNFIKLPQKSGIEKHIEMIGMKKIMNKQSNFSCLTNVVLSRMLVNGPGNQHELKELAPNINDLDLSHNLLHSWEQINEIAKQLEKLNTLILSKNRIGIPRVLNYQECYKPLKTLILNDLTYNWSEILTCAIMWPGIEELSVQDNCISDLENPTFPIFSKLSYLSLDNNCIQNWLEICKLGKLQNLKELHLDNTCLESITFSDVPPLEKTELFLSLETLFLRNNKLNKWQDISELNKLSSLKNLVSNNNPVISSENPETARQFVIARIENLEYLNRIKVERSERRGAELDYIKKFYNDWLLDDSDKKEFGNKISSQFLNLHPTYPNLLQKHGAPEANEMKTQSTLIKDNLLSVQFVSPLLPENPPLTKKLPVEMTVEKLKVLVKRMFKVSMQEIKLYLIFNQDESLRTELDNNLRQLSYYSISDRDKICVEW